MRDRNMGYEIYRNMGFSDDEIKEIGELQKIAKRNIEEGLKEENRLKKQGKFKNKSERLIREPRELTDAELEILYYMDDSRSVNDNLYKAFCDKDTGSLYAFNKFIRDYNRHADDHKKLMALLRDDSIIVYKNNHMIWDLGVLSDGTGRVQFDFNHSRYTENWMDVLEILVSKEYGFKVAEDRADKPKERPLKDRPELYVERNETNEISKAEIGIISSYGNRNKFTDAYVKNIFDIFNSLIDDFFMTSENENSDISKDWFRWRVGAIKRKDNKISKTRKVYPEKMWQQRLYFSFNNLKDGYFVYDLEFSQPFPTSIFVEKYAKEKSKEVKEEYSKVFHKELKEMLTTNEPDMLAVHYDNGVPVAIAIIEVKSTKSACVDPSGIKEHLIGMYEYSHNPIFMRHRKIEAFKIMKQLRDFGFISGDINEPSNEEDIYKLKVERILLLTNDTLEKGVSAEKIDGGAIKYYEMNRKEVDDLAKKYDCKIWTTDNCYYNDIIDFNIMR